MKKVGTIIKWTVLVFAVLILASCGAAIYGLGSAANESEDKANQYAQVKNQIQMGMTEAEVVALAGEPENRQVNDYDSGGVKMHTVYLYYGILNENSVQLVFEDDSLRAINTG